MKILFLACLNKNESGNTFGGAEKSIVKLTDWISKKRKEDRVILASVQGSENTFLDDCQFEFYGTKQYKGKFVTHLMMLWNTWKIILSVRPNIVVSFWIHPLFYAIPLKMILGFKMYHSIRNAPKQGYKRITSILRECVLDKSDGIVFQTHDAMQEFPKYKDKSCVIFNPTYIKYDDYPLPKKRNNKVVNVGRLVPQKNQILLIEAFNHIHREYPELILEIYGEGYLKEELQNLINSLGANEYIFLRGVTKNILDKIYGARLFVLTSKYEGMPNALIEAMCVGTPVVSSDCPCGGPRELIDDGVNGILFREGNLDELIIAIKYALKKDEKISLKAKKICDSNSEDEIFNKWVEFIMRV